MLAVRLPACRRVDARNPRLSADRRAVGAELTPPCQEASIPTPKIGCDVAVTPDARTAAAAAAECRGMANDSVFTEKESADIAVAYMNLCTVLQHAWERGDFVAMRQVEAAEEALDSFKKELPEVFGQPCSPDNCTAAGAAWNSPHACDAVVTP